MKSGTVFVLALVWAVAVVFAVHFLNFPGSVPDFRDASGGGILLDTKPSFTPDEIYQRLDAYGEAGRGNYSFRNMTVDIVLPLSLLPFLWLLMRNATAKFAQHKFLRIGLLALPVTYVVFDLVENATVLSLLTDFPARLDALASTLPYTSLIKRVASMAALAVPLGLMAFSYLRTRSHKAAG